MTFAVLPDNSSEFRVLFRSVYERKGGTPGEVLTSSSWNPKLLVRDEASRFFLAELRVRHSHPQAVKRMAGEVAMLQDDVSSYAFE